MEEGLFDWYEFPTDHGIKHVSSRQALMFVVDEITLGSQFISFGREAHGDDVRRPRSSLRRRNGPSKADYALSETVLSDKKGMSRSLLKLA